ncbi:glutathione peroxidase [Enterococcus sp.]|uniref:glutathione peroxidase n=1 Tax=Enterococcus sp. TaxID=35783 RepID=UPI002FC64163
MSIYSFNATLENGQTYSLDNYRGKVIIIVNTATKCGLTPQFEELEAIYEAYKEQGLIILGFPSNQFKQELATGTEAAEACRLTYGVTFPMHELTVVNGEEADPLYKYLKKQAPGFLNDEIKWNFTKFIIDQEGQVVARFAPKDEPNKMLPTIKDLLAKNQ